MAAAFSLSSFLSNWHTQKISKEEARENREAVEGHQPGYLSRLPGCYLAATWLLLRKLVLCWSQQQTGDNCHWHTDHALCSSHTKDTHWTQAAATTTTVDTMRIPASASSHVYFASLNSPSNWIRANHTQSSLSSHQKLALSHTLWKLK